MSQPKVFSEKCSTFAVRRRGGPDIMVTVDSEDLDRVVALGRWNLDQRGYVVRCRRGKPHLKLHRFVIGAQSGDPMVDHRNGDKLDNRKSNLRQADPLMNGANLSPINSRGQSRFRGVTFHAKSGKWRAAQRINRKYYSLGLHSTQEAAAEALAQFRRDRNLGER